MPTPIYEPKPLQSLRDKTKDEIKAYAREQVAQGKLPRNWTMEQADRLYKNQQFAASYTPEVYSQITNKNSENYLSPEERDNLYNYNEYTKGIRSKYANDPNLPYYSTLTLEGMEDFWNSGILSPEELQEQEDSINALRKSNEQNKFTPKSKFVAAMLAPTQESSTNVSVKDVADAFKYKRGLLSEDEAEKYERKLSNKIQEQTDLLQGTISTGLNDDDVDKLISKLYSSQRKKIEDFQIREDNRVLNLPTVKAETDTRIAQWHRDVNDGKLTYQEVEDEYRKLFDNDIRKDGAGSRYYTGYKNRVELSNFDVDDMIEKLAQFSVLSEAYGDSAKAMQTVDSGFFNQIKDNESWGLRRWRTIEGVGAKANAMLANELWGGWVELAHSIADNPAEYRTFKTAEDVLNKNGVGFLFNPNYWNYVDQYVVWSPSEIQRLNQNGGVGGRVNLYSPTGKMTAEQFVDEGFKMLGYMLPAVALTAVTKNVPRGSAWASVLSAAEVAGSAAALGSTYSSGTYNKITLEADQALNEMFNQRAGDFIQEYYEQHPDYIENYLEQQGLDENSSSLFLINAQQQAYHNLYEDAKEEFFRQNPAELEVYQEAQKRILADAKLGSVADFGIETARMLVAGSLWGKWTKSKLTRDLANKGFNPIKVEEGVAKQAITRSSGRRREAGVAVLSGGVDNWLDDITAGIGEGLGLGSYNNWLGSQYSPDGLITGATYTADIIDGILLGRDGAIKAFHDPQTWIDGAIGAAGTVLGTRVNGVTLVRDLAKGENMFSKKGSEARKEWMNEGFWQRLDRYVTNGAITSAAAADERFDRTEQEVKRINESVIPNFRKDIGELGNLFNEIIYYNTIAQEILDAKDAKQMSMVKTAVRMLDAYNDPVLSQLPEVQKFADFAKRGKNGNFTYEELQSFINDSNNLNIKNAVDSDGNSISEEMARETMQHNIKKYLEVFDKYEKLRKRIDKNEDFAALPVNGKTQIAVQLLLRDRWKERLDMMQEDLGTPGTEKATWNYDAEFGSKKGRDRVLKSLESLIERDKRRLEEAEKVVEDKRKIYEKAVTTEGEEAARKEYFDAVYIKEAFRQQHNANVELLNEKAKANVVYDEEGNARTLSKEEIMHLSPKQRAKMLDPQNRRDYSTEQRRILDELADDLKNHIDSEGNTQDLLQVVLDAGIMQERYENSNTSIKKVVKSPLIFTNYIERLRDRQAAMIAQAAIQDIHDADLEKLANVTNSQEAIDVIYRGLSTAKSLNRGFYVQPEIVKEYLQKHPEAKELMSDALDMVRTRDDFYIAADSLFEPGEATPIKVAIAGAVKDANSREEIISAVESLMDAQTESSAKLQYDRVLDFMQKIGHQRDATKVRNRELEREKRREAELKRLEEEAKKDGKNYNWDGYKVGDTVYNKETGNQATVVGFEKTATGENKMLVQAKYADGTTGTFRYDSNTGKDKITKEKPQKEIVASVTELPEEPPTRDMSQYQLTELGDVNLTVDSEGATASPTAQQQAVATGAEAIPVPERDVTDQGNVVEESAGVVSGNRWVTYSISDLKDGVVREEIPENPNSIYGRVFNWLKEKGIKLQEIIDNEFSRMLADNPNLEIQFMTIDPNKNSGLQKVLFPVVKLTDAMREKYHNQDQDRGGIIQANGESWLIVGTSGFDSSASDAQRKAMDTMRAPINQRRAQYFAQNKNETYYVDPVAKTKVHSTTSGRIVNQAEGASAPRLKRVSELLASAKMSLKQAQFGIQTKENGEKGFTTTKNVTDKTKVFPPRNAEDNRGRTFILIDTANGNKIPGMIEPAMLNEIPEESRLRDIIDSLLARLASTNYASRVEAIKELCGYLVLGDEKNILIGKEGADVLTIRRKGYPDISQSLGANFDLVKFLDDVKSANFQINTTLRSLNDPVMLKIYDDAGALMTTVDSMRTAGMSYNLYMTDENGKPVVITPAYNPKPGTGKTDFKTYRSVRVNNTTYELKNGQFVNRTNGNKVNPGTSLEQSCYYNLEIQESQRSPFYSKGNKQYFQMPNGDGYFVLTRDSLGNVEILDEATAMALFADIERARADRERAQNLQDVDLGEPAPQPEPQQVEEVPLTQEQIAAQEFGDFSSPAEVTAPAPQLVKEIVTEAKETQSTSSKEAVSDMGTKSLEELQKSKNSYTFADVISNVDYIERVYDILGQKDWGITGNLAKDADILKSKGISVVGITNVEDWINLIRDCK